MSKRVLVAGCGAVGSVFACLLRAAGHSVSILARGKHAAAAAVSGLRVIGIWGEHEAGGIVVARAARELDRDYDAVFVACKSYQTDGLLADVGDRATRRGVAVALQNGLGNVERLAAVYGPERALAARVIFGAELMAPGVARVTVEAEPVLLGRPGARADGVVSDWAALIATAGIRCEATDNIAGALWGKVFYNAALNPLGALLGLSYGELAADAERREVMSAVARRCRGARSTHISKSSMTGWCRLRPSTAPRCCTTSRKAARPRSTRFAARSADAGARTAWRSR